MATEDPKNTENTEGTEKPKKAKEEEKLRNNRALLVLDMLWNHTDQGSPVTLEQLKDYVEQGELARPSSKALKNDIALLGKMGLNIVQNRSVQYQYFIASRCFGPAQLQLLIDAVQSAKFITRETSQELIDELMSFAGPQQKRNLNAQLYMDCAEKSGNTSVINNVDHIHDAITMDQKITFQYFDYSPKKEKILRHDGYRYCVSPYATLWHSDQYYMIGYSERHGSVATFRIDRITRLRRTEEKRVPPPPDLDLSACFRQTFSMLGGRETTVTLLCENELMGSIIDRFGEDVRTETADAKHFKATVVVSLSNTFYGWVFASGGKMRILGPDCVVEEFQNLIARYQ